MRIVKEQIDNVLRKMCFGTTREHSEQIVERIYQTNGFDDGRSCSDEYRLEGSGNDGSQRG